MGNFLSFTKTYFDAKTWQGSAMMMAGSLAAVVLAKQATKDTKNEFLALTLRFVLVYVLVYLFTSLGFSWGLKDRCKPLPIKEVSWKATIPPLIIALGSLVAHLLSIFLTDPITAAVAGIGVFIVPMYYSLVVGPIMIAEIGSRCAKSSA
jgi:hypothetical protein